MIENKSLKKSVQLKLMIEFVLKKSFFWDLQNKRKKGWKINFLWLIYNFYDHN